MPFKVPTQHLSHHITGNSGASSNRLLECAKQQGSQCAKEPDPHLRNIRCWPQPGGRRAKHPPPRALPGLQLGVARQLRHNPRWGRGRERKGSCRQPEKRTRPPPALLPRTPPPPALVPRTPPPQAPLTRTPPPPAPLPMTPPPPAQLPRTPPPPARSLSHPPARRPMSAASTAVTEAAASTASGHATSCASGTTADMAAIPSGQSYEAGGQFQGPGQLPCAVLTVVFATRVRAPGGGAGRQWQVEYGVPAPWRPGSSWGV
ncbi:hypothetical protein NDU88_003997 [Pleurodeles waltl]|uniref:Uncharacterized protein n=1 Tax=Pleurodeles waltl TaxID=8319 RepID=A0AAV7VHZ1_PLEWA|nr:hypothetical protein NDU88_003997 [Pleurodeles waltl]